LQPDVLVVIADRYESLALAQAALCLNIRIAHLEGGELSGSIDERIRHAISKLAHYHFPASEEAAARLVRLGEPKEAIRAVGSPSFDLLREDGGFERLAARLSGFDLEREFLLVSQHPVVTEYAEAPRQYSVVMDSLHRLKMPVVLVWPNNDAGAQAIAGSLADLRSRKDAAPVAIVAGLPIEEFSAALRRTACLVGNSSSGIREAAYLGTPAVNIGTRQSARIRSANVVDVPCDAEAIVEAVRRQIAHGCYPSDRRYGDGTAGSQIADFLASYWPPLDKRMTY
jgi:UDP-hydrolysing UDP-N-acetyl-D-glucosamine 2-epimerase